jgi:hypothetical protein
MKAIYSFSFYSERKIHTFITSRPARAAMLPAVHAMLLTWQTVPAVPRPCRNTFQRRSASPVAISDAAVVGAAGAILCAAGYLQYSVSAGEKGLTAFLLKEKDQNPFYKPSFKADKPQGASWFTLRLPDLPFVEVYGQPEPPERFVGSSSRSQLYTDLDAAVEREDYVKAAEIKRRIDATFGSARDEGG